ncbi:hypothetical protein G7Y79_00040g077290 [Physcia stellaris]|nr:hypothetical protein G7Y79_00040g077290 [Physcia stellaris]
MSDYSLNDVAKDQKLVHDHKRVLNSKYKWALGEAVITAGHPSRRPVGPRSSGQGRALSREKAWVHQHSTTRLPRKHGADFDVSDSSAEEDVREASAAPEPDAEILYSFDAPRGPAEGGQILSMALAKAVEKFETKETEKLVKNEYEVIGNEKEDGHDGYAADEDDFQLI